jgi:hypothetical protein
LPRGRNRAPPGKLGLNRSCNAANVPRKTLEIMKDNGAAAFGRIRIGNDQILINIKKGVRIDIAREFRVTPGILGSRLRDIHS